MLVLVSMDPESRGTTFIKRRRKEDCCSCNLSNSLPQSPLSQPSIARRSTFYLPINSTGRINACTPACLTFKLQTWTVSIYSGGGDQTNSDQSRSTCPYLSAEVSAVVSRQQSPSDWRTKECSERNHSEDHAQSCPCLPNIFRQASHRCWKQALIRSNNQSIETNKCVETRFVGYRDPAVRQNGSEDQ